MSLSDEQLHACERTLLDMKRATEKLLHSSEQFGTENELIKDSVGDLSSYDNHPADHGTELFEREKDLALRNHTEDELLEIKEALKRMKVGNYGVCEVCQSPIPYERLQAHPTARHCIEHSSSEQVQRPSDQNELGLKKPRAKGTAFDAEDSWQDVARWGTSETPSDFFSNKKVDYNKMYSDADEQIGIVEGVEASMTERDGAQLSTEEEDEG